MAMYDPSGLGGVVDDSFTRGLGGAQAAKDQFLLGGAQTALTKYGDHLAALEMAKAYKDANRQKSRDSIFENLIGGVTKIAGGPIGAGIAGKLFPKKA